MTADRLRVVLCSTSAGTHVLAGVLSDQPDVEVTVLTLNEDKARAWQRSLHDAALTVTVPDGGGTRVAHTARDLRVTCQPDVAAEGADIVVLAVPAFLHSAYLAALAAHLDDGCVVVGLPGHGGFEQEVRRVLPPGLRHVGVVNFDALPWIARVVEPARAVHVAATKNVLAGALDGDLGGSRVPDLPSTLQRLLGAPPRLVVAGHPLGITLRAPNASVHPPVMYRRWKDWDGQPLAEAPPFYREIDEEAASLIAGISRECVATAEVLMLARPDADLSQVVDALEWELAAYGSLIADPTDLMTALRTNSGHHAARHPMKEVAPGRLVPDFGHRFLAEDIPYGLVVVRGIAEIAGVDTPTIDLVLSWGQDKLGKVYLTPAGLTGRDVATSRAPQRYGLTTVAELVGEERSQPPAFSALPLTRP